MRQSGAGNSEQQGRGIAKKCHELEDVGVFWTNAFCLYLLHILPPKFWIIYLDTDAVLFDQLVIDLPNDVKPPCIASAT
eukprot:10237188-Karenia_brevis.AAC.1